MEVTVDLRVEDLFYHFEVMEAGKPYREFVIPAAVLNTRGKCAIRRLAADEVDYHESSAAPYWNEYPPGEPENTFAELQDEELSEGR